MADSAENRRVKITLMQCILLFLRTRLWNGAIRFDTTEDTPYVPRLLDLKANGIAEIWNEAVLPWMALAAFFYAPKLDAARNGVSAATGATCITPQ